MKSILQYVTVMSVVALLASCSDNSSPRGAVPSTPPLVATPPDPDGVGGTAVKGLIIGGAVTVVDGNGNDVPIAAGGETRADGTYAIVLPTDVSLDSIALPVVVQVRGGGGATSVCDVNRNVGGDGANDCLTIDGVSYVAFGETFELPADFLMEAVLAALPDDSSNASTTVTANMTPATHLQTTLARAASGGAGAPITVAAVTEARDQVLGLIESLTGIQMDDVDLASIEIVDASTIDADEATASPQSLAITAFAAAVAGLVDADDDTQDNVQEVLVNLAAQISSGDDGLELNGDDLSELATAVAESLNDISEQFAAAGVDNEVTAAVETAQSSAEQSAEEGSLIGANPVVIAPAVVDPTTATPKALANSFLDSFINVLTVWTDTTGAEEGTTNTAPTEVLFTELATAETYGAGAATHAFDNLADALIAAEASLEPGASVVNDDTDQDNMQFTLSKDAAGVVTLTDGWAMMMDTARMTRATVTIASGTYSRDPGVSGQLAMTGVELLTEMIGETDAQLQHFMGSVTADFGPDATDPGDLGLTTLTYDGTHLGTSNAGNSFNVTATLSNLSGTALEDGGSGRNISGDYTITFSFDGDQDIALNFNGVLRSTTQNLWISGSGDTIMGTISVPEDSNVETTTLTDGTATLTVMIDTGTSPTSLMSAVITIGETEVATVDADGLVTFGDDSIRFLPAGLL
jgi:hypothetical protein